MKLYDYGKRSGHKVPKANIGGMRLPKDLDTAVSVIRAAIDAGMRYIDTSRGYGESEWLIGRALKDGYREKVLLSTKWSPWVTKIRPDDDTSSDAVRRRIDESMKRLDVDHLDYYQVWNIDSREHYEQAVARGGMVDGIRKAIGEGLVGHTGFTTHDSVENVIDYAKEADWCEIILFTYNMLNRQYAPAIEAARRNGIATVIMNPVGGGQLAQESPVLMEIAREVGAESVPDLSIRYVLSNPNVDTIISGLTRMSDVADTVASAGRPLLTPAQVRTVDGHIDRILAKTKAFCTACRYCMPCPEGIDIPAILSCINDYRFWGWKESAKARYKALTSKKADACVKCGKCEKACTQHLKIMQEMDFAKATFID